METKYVIWPLHYGNSLKLINSHDSGLPENLAPWEDLIELWRQIMKLVVRNPIDIQKSIEEFSSVYMIGHKEYINLLSSWNKCLSQVAKASLSVRENEIDKEQLLKVSIQSWKDFFETLNTTKYNYSSELIKAYFKYLQAFKHKAYDLTETTDRKR